MKQSNPTNTNLLQQLHDALQLVQIDNLMSTDVENMKCLESMFVSPFAINTNEDMLLGTAEPQHTTNIAEYGIPDKEIAQIYSTLTNDQRAFVRIFLENAKTEMQGLFFLTGNAGSGKSYLLSFIIKLIKYKFFNVVTNVPSVIVAAPTGLAAQR